MPIQIDRKTTASLDIDSQNTFTEVCPDELPIQDGTVIVDALNAQAQFTAYRVGSKDAHSPNAIWVASSQHPPQTPLKCQHVDVYWPRHAEVGTKGFELIQGLPHVTEYDFFVWKGIEPDMHPYGACYHDFDNQLSTGLIEFLRTKKIKTVIAGGLATDYCVKTTVLQLLNAGFRVVVNLAACRGISEDTIETAKKDMQSAGATFIDSTADLAMEP